LAGATVLYVAVLALALQ